METMTLKQAAELKQKGHVVWVYPKKKIIKVDGFKQYKLKDSSGGGR